MVDLPLGTTAVSLRAWVERGSYQWFVAMDTFCPPRSESTAVVVGAEQKASQLSAVATALPLVRFPSLEDLEADLPVSYPDEGLKGVAAPLEAAVGFSLTGLRLNCTVLAHLAESRDLSGCGRFFGAIFLPSADLVHTSVSLRSIPSLSQASHIFSRWLQRCCWLRRL